MINHPGMLPRLEEPQREDEEGPQRRQQQRGDGMFLWGLSRKPQWQHPPGQQERRAERGSDKRDPQGSATLG